MKKEVLKRVVNKSYGRELKLDRAQAPQIFDIVVHVKQGVYGIIRAIYGEDDGFTYYDVEYVNEINGESYLERTPAQNWRLVERTELGYVLNNLSADKKTTVNMSFGRENGKTTATHIIDEINKKGE